MSLLPPRFQEPIMAGPLGPVIKPAPAVPELHVHDWRPSAASKDHVTCSCGQVSLREFVMPPEVKLSDDGQDADWAAELREAWRQGAGYRMSQFWREYDPLADARAGDFVWEQFKREDAVLVIDRKRAVASGSVFEQQRREDELQDRLRAKFRASWAR